MDSTKFEDLANIENLDDIILEEKRLVAQEHFLDAWEAGLSDGIEAEIIAKELIFGALRQLTISTSQAKATSLIEALNMQDALGNFLPNKTVQ